jgi:TetR/AcrR family transcriptional repressor of nem operon
MARYSRQHTKASRDAILASASRLFRLRGYEGVGIPEIARGAGLTHGAFYSHFASKEELLREVVIGARKDRKRKIVDYTREGGYERARSVIAYYLGEDHALSPERGCLVPTLGADLVRKRGRTAELGGTYVDSFVAEFMDCGLPRARARHIVATMIGGVMAARLLGREARVEFLRDVRHECLHEVEWEKFR